MSNMWPKKSSVRRLSKAGTPTMGGVIILFAVAVSTLLWANLEIYYIWVCLFVMLGLGSVGFLDDYRKLIKKQNQGLTAKEKFIYQIVITFLAGLMLVIYPKYPLYLSIPFIKGWSPYLGVFYIPFSMLVVIGASNAVNLSDGLDGLAIGPVIVASLTYLIFSYLAGHVKIANYLQLPSITGAGELVVFCGAIIGAGVGFLWFNSYPAQVFMGDVGSLGLGGALGIVATVTKQELLLVLVGGIFVIEALSVIAQVGFFKLTHGKRIFRMAPLHHHFELKGWAEPKVSVRFWIIAFVLSLLSIATLKLR
ncbi:MAG: phospho-N-acetylmuramoyl-pentapeptide-transferase [Deltaproteobacteria bacterium]|nr:phospho-N-acetylmuramoyl-pentapeptide-transferase [Deltaproteobacteria bacterium]